MSLKKSEKELYSLSQVYKDYFTIGAAVNATTIDSQKELLIHQFNSITAENEMKPENLQPEEGRFTFETADRFVAFAEENKMNMRGHTLLWHNQTPEWMFTGREGSIVEPSILQKRLENHISTVVSRYKGQIKAWDVVNEAIDDSPDLFFRKTKWLDILGDDYIEKAFHFAHEADSEALLFYNDYNECFPEKREKIFTLVKSLKEKDVPIHGIGMQGHWNLRKPVLEDIRCAIEKYASIGVQIHLTEMDISVFDWEDQRIDLKQPSTEMVELQEERYEQIFNLLREYKEVISNVTFWGAADDYTWLDDFPVRGRKNWPFVFDVNHAPKNAFWKITNFK